MDIEKLKGKIINVIHNCFLAESYLAIIKKIDADINNLESYRNLSILIIRGLTDALVIKTSKIYDDNSKGSSILHILNFNRVSYYLGKDNQDLKVIREYIEKQRKILEDEEMVNLRGNLKSWRDKFYVHTDTNFLNNEELLREYHNINTKEFEELINFAKRTSQHLYALIGKKFRGSSIKFICEKEFEGLIWLLEDHKRIYGEYEKSIDGV